MPAARSKARKIMKKILWSAISLLLVIIIFFLIGVFHGRFNFKYRTVEIEYENLPASLEGFTIVHISDLHLDSFTNHKDKLISVVDSINAIKPDIIANTGDFVTILFTEMEPFTGILGKLKAEYGVYNVPGNHDTGLYSGEYERDNYSGHLELIGRMLRESGQVYLSDTSRLIMIDTLTVSLTGVVTYGRVPDLYYGDINEAMEGTEGSDFSILLSHDPDYWLRYVDDREDIQLTLSGHTHGMQMGIMFPGFRFSPAQLLYPAWYGMYGGDNNYLYINPGLGTIGMPARIGMPPEITVIRLKGKN